MRVYVTYTHINIDVCYMYMCVYVIYYMCYMYMCVYLYIIYVMCMCVYNCRCIKTSSLNSAQY